MTLTPGDFGASFKGFLDQMSANVPTEDPVFVKHLRVHFGEDPSTLPIIAQKFDAYELANVHLALEEYLKGPERAANLLGVTANDFLGTSLADLVAPPKAGLIGGGMAVSEGPVQYVNVQLAGEQMVTCVQSGLFLISNGDDRMAALLRASDNRHLRAKTTIEVMGRNREAGEKFLAEIRTIMRKRSIYRGQVVSIGLDELHSMQVKFHRLDKIERQNIILPKGLLGRIERQTIGFSKHSAALMAAKRHLKRGLLLHGKPGTGKTLTAMYLAGQMPDRTVILLTGRGLSMIEQSCSLARALEPATVILEDVDLIAEERTRANACGSLLFELLNEMDGLRNDADVLFILTTNRPEILEPALSARPGRIDQTFEVPLPDIDCRRQLFTLYADGLSLKLEQTDKFIERTKGASPAFIKELFRKAALFAADDSNPIEVRDKHVDEALHELVVQGGDLTKSLLGFRAEKMEVGLKP